MIIFLEPALWTVLLCVMIGFAVTESFIGLSVIALLALIVKGAFFGLPSLWWLLNPIYIAPYLLIGLAWMFFRWTLYVENTLTENARYQHAKEGPPEWNSHHSEGFSAYFFWWPIDVVAYLLTDVLGDLWNLVSKLVAKPFNRYAEWRFKEASK